ncbi:MAG: outer membrane lipoprotein carrier protein LolA [Acidobacteria bacterium]|nr:outer membrane lipoprotein carrier protein LolA [Acidobacteriota bacterium]
MFLCVWGAGPGAAHAESLEDVLARIDKAAASFRGMTARLHRVQYTAVIKDTSEETGALAMKQTKARDLQLKIDFTSPDQKSWAFRGKKAELYVPKINTVQEYDLGKHARLLDQFLLLGFGSSSKDLARSYTLKLEGDEVLQGQRTSKVELAPLQEEARRHLKRVEIWFPHDSGFPIQQKFHLASGDYVLVGYSDIKLDPNLPDSAVRLNLPKNVKREYPQK